ncbi:hypothetical protein LCGC14_0548860 [marine sediment metagenome]|uniref:Uncharacterized protein n=1 Tax=marine sediment metagenome TaxID=412755 RepID=A0A0F9UC39_9ZZZZ
MMMIFKKPDILSTIDDKFFDIAKVISITYQDTKPWILDKHYANRMPNVKYSFGLLFKSQIIGICTFGIPGSPFLCKGICGIEYKDNVLELNRLVINDGVPRNSASFLVANSIKQLPPKSILVSYADTKMGHIGYVYQATNWIYTGCTKERTDIYAGDGKHSRHHLGDKSNRQQRSAKHRYVYFHKCPKEIKNNLRYPVLSYPKGETRRYKTPKIATQQMLF